MKLSDAINQGIDRLPSQTATALAGYLGVSQSDLSAARTGRKGLKEEACIELAQLIHADPLEILAASKIVTAKDEETRAIWRPFAKAATVAPIAAITLTAVILEMTPTTAQALPASTSLPGQCILCKT